MIDEYTDDRSGWARFSDDKTMRYRLGRVLVPGLGPFHRLVGGGVTVRDAQGVLQRIVKVTFLMINPSTADAFEPDPTIGRCVKFATGWGAHVLDVANLFAFRSPFPNDLKIALDEGRDLGDDRANDIQILRACTGADLVIAAWGNHGKLKDRDAHVRRMLDARGIDLHYLGLNENGTPKHPLARGRARIPDNTEPALWRVEASL